MRNYYGVLIFVIVTTSISLIVIGSSQVQIVMAQQGLNGTSFQIGQRNILHRLAPVNGIQLHYVIGGHGPPVVLLHGWPETWFEFVL